MNKKIILTKGLPASGKSEWSKSIVDKDHSYKRISMDDLRSMIDNGYWDGDRTEKLIVEIRNLLIETMMKRGCNIIVDATNLHQKHQKTIQELVNSNNEDVEENGEFYGTQSGKKYELEIKSFLDVPIDECIKRDSEREDPVGKDVIMHMAKQYNLSDKPQSPIYNDQLPDAIIVDIDGTLAHNTTGRGFYDWDRVDEDTIDEDVLNLVYKYQKNHTVIVLSGRDIRCRKITESWLLGNNVPYDQLFMRPLGNTEPDEKIKKEIYNELIKGKYNVSVVIDDRNKVVKMWRDLGLKVFQVADGNF